MKKSKHVGSSLLQVGFSGERGKRSLLGEKIDFKDVSFGHGGGKVAAVAAVVLWRGSDVPTNLAVFTKGSASVGRDVGNDFGSEWGKRCAIVVKITEEGCLGGKRRMNAAGAEKVQSKDGLWEKAIPFAEGKVGIDSAEDRNQVILESTDSSFGGIGTMFLGWHALKGDIVFLEGIFESLRTFVVKNVELGSMTSGEETFVGRFPGIADASGLAIGNGNGVNRIGVMVIKNKNVIVATA